MKLPRGIGVLVLHVLGRIQAFAAMIHQPLVQARLPTAAVSAPVE
jgi:hypothetical protein